MSPNTPDPDSVDTLMNEIQSYLGVVECFRSEGCEPRWSCEVAPNAQAPPVEGVSPRLVSPRRVD
jgi:hypothetical protein